MVIIGVIANTIKEILDFINLLAPMTLILIGLLLPPFYYVRVKGYNQMGIPQFTLNLAVMFLGIFIGFNLIQSSFKNELPPLSN